MVFSNYHWKVEYFCSPVKHLSVRDKLVAVETEYVEMILTDSKKIFPESIRVPKSDAEVQMVRVVFFERFRHCREEGVKCVQDEGSSIGFRITFLLEECYESLTNRPVLPVQDKLTKADFLVYPGRFIAYKIADKPWVTNEALHKPGYGFINMLPVGRIVSITQTHKFSIHAQVIHRDNKSHFIPAVNLGI